jgi:3-dehydroquinate dehydratase-1
MRSLLCTTISATDGSEMAKKAKLALSMGSDLVELRIDHLQDPSRETVLGALSELFPRAVITVRPAAEGGHFTGRESERLDLLSELASGSPAFVDVELATVERGFEILARSSSTKVIVSWHDFEGTPPPRDLEARTAAAAGFGEIAKVVTTARRSEDNETVLSLYNTMPHERLIAFCMGALGVRSRIEAMRMGSPLTYCSLPSEPVAPGQIPLTELRKLESSRR